MSPCLLSSSCTSLLSVPTTEFYIPPPPMVSSGLEAPASFSLRPTTVLPESHTCFCYSYCYAKTPDESILRKNEFNMASVQQGRGRHGGRGVSWLLTLCLPSGSQERPTWLLIHVLSFFCFHSVQNPGVWDGGPHMQSASSLSS